jgi:hypothetical protein
VTVAETLLVYAGAPLAVFLVLVLLTYVPGGRKRPRWKPGQPWDHEPVWYAPHPPGGGGGGHEAPAFGAAVPGAATKAIGSSVYGEPERSHGGERSGTADHSPGGSSSSGASRAPAHPVPAGPLGGARGTW